MRTHLRLAVSAVLILSAVAAACESSSDEAADAAASADGGPGDGSPSPDSATTLADAGTFDATTTLADGATADATTTLADGATGDAMSADAAVDADAATTIVDAGFPALGVYTVDIDGGGLTLLVDAGTRELSHVRVGADGGWLVATHYGKDPDSNGLAMENENGIGAYYEGTEVATFPLASPYATTVITGTPSGVLACNPSWTDDGKVLYLAQAPSDAGTTKVHLERATFGVVPSVSAIATVPVPPELLVPVDPHQHGPSDATGFITFTALFQGGAKWYRPIFKMPATGTTLIGQSPAFGCPICPLQGGCCGFDTIPEVIGTNDSRISHSGGEVLWMQQHPDKAAVVGPTTFYPYHQAKRPTDGGAQVDLIPNGASVLTTFSYGEWRPDDQEVTYWTIEVDGAVLRMHLWVMSPDGSNRRQIPLPGNLCPLHPSYITPTRIVFNAWRGAASDGSCDVAKIP